jgi:hypothetical protein
MNLLRVSAVYSYHPGELVFFSYLWFCIHPDDENIYPKHVADLCIYKFCLDYVVVGGDQG